MRLNAALLTCTIASSAFATRSRVRRRRAERHRQLGARSVAVVDQIRARAIPCASKEIRGRAQATVGNTITARTADRLKHVGWPQRPYATSPMRRLAREGDGAGPDDREAQDDLKRASVSRPALDARMGGTERDSKNAFEGGCLRRFNRLELHRGRTGRTNLL